MSKPIIDPDPDHFENAVEVVTENAARWLPLKWRIRAQNLTIILGGIALTIAGLAAALAPALGGQVGDVLASVAAAATAVGTLLGTALAVLSRANAADPVKTVTVDATTIHTAIPGVNVGVDDTSTGFRDA